MNISSLARPKIAQVRQAWAQGRSIACQDADALAAVLEALGPGAAVHLVALHDDGCSPIACRCEPSFRLEPMTPENVLKGARGQKQWERETVN